MYVILLSELKSGILSDMYCLLFPFQAPRTSRSSLVKGRSHANAVAQQALIAHWQSIVKSLNNYLKIMKANYVSCEIHANLGIHCFTGFGI